MIRLFIQNTEQESLTLIFYQENEKIHKWKGWITKKVDNFFTMSLFAYKYKKVIDLEMRLFKIDFGV